MTAPPASPAHRRRQPLVRALGLAASLAAAAPGLAGAAELPTRDRHVISAGHVDAVGVHLDAGALSLRVHDDSGETPVVRDPGETLLHAKPESALTVPDGLPPIYQDVLGPAGSTVWLLPQVQDPALLWPGWSSEEIAAGALEGNRLTWRLLSLDGPGELSVFQEGAFGLEPSGIRFDSGDGLPDTTTMNVGTHAHFSWAFTAAGLYRARFEVSGTPAGAAAPVSTGPVEYRFFVGDLAELPEDPVVTALSIGGARPSYEEGETVALEAIQSPATGLHHYHWFERCGDAAEETEVGGGASLSFAAETRHDGCAYRVVLYGEDHAPVATSPAATLRVRARRATEPDTPPAHTPPGGEQPPAPTPPGGEQPPAPRAPEAPLAPRPQPPVGGARLTARVGAATATGRRLSLRLRVSRGAVVRAVVRRGGRRVAVAPAVRVGRGGRVARLRLGRALPPGRYRVVVRVRGGGRALTRTVALTVTRPR